ncbi:hypothetical protein GCM10022226_23530 [Sphaerisporangium flaviroseum]|uniref:DUF1761 domain-containing protein n=1 Tax=Sphaerisporangium flaviroseum TaxID=509199 RepID=A0ABP7HVT0_9ACTN
MTIVTTLGAVTENDSSPVGIAGAVAFLASLISVYIGWHQLVVARKQLATSKTEAPPYRRTPNSRVGGFGWFAMFGAWILMILVVTFGREMGITADTWAYKLGAFVALAVGVGNVFVGLFEGGQYGCFAHLILLGVQFLAIVVAMDMLDWVSAPDVVRGILSFTKKSLEHLADPGA